MNTPSESPRKCPDDDDDRGQRLAIAHSGLYFFRSLVWDLFESGQYSDFTIRVKGSAREFRVHRAVVCPQSQILEAACRGEFVEASTNTITLSDEDPEIVDRMVKYLYTHRYDDDEDYDVNADPFYPEGATAGITDFITSSEKKDENSQQTIPLSGVPSTSSDRKPHSIGSSSGVSYSNSKDNGHSPVPNSLRVYAIADRYLILPLKELARMRFIKWAAHHWSSPRFLSAVRDIFDGETGNYSELHEAVIAPLVRHADHLLYSEGNTGLSQLLYDYGEISVEILRRVLEQKRISQHGLEVDVAELQSRVEALRCENQKIDVLQNHNRRLTKELLDVNMTVVARRRSCSSPRGLGDTPRRNRNGNGTGGHNRVNSGHPRP